MTNLSNEELHAEVAKAGLRLVPKDHVTELENLTKRIDRLTLESEGSHAASIATKTAVTEMTDDIKPLLQEIRQELRETRQEVRAVVVRVTYLESAKASHAETLTELARDARSHESDITGLHKRIAVVEETLTKNPRTPRRKKSKRKGPRK